MFDFFGNGRKKSLDEMMKDLEEMLGSSYNPMGGGYVVGKHQQKKEQMKMVIGQKKPSHQKMVHTKLQVL